MFESSISNYKENKEKFAPSPQDFPDLRNMFKIYSYCYLGLKKTLEN